LEDSGAKEEVPPQWGSGARIGGIKKARIRRKAMHEWGGKEREQINKKKLPTLWIGGKKKGDALPRDCLRGRVPDEDQKKISGERPSEELRQSHLVKDGEEVMSSAPCFRVVTPGRGGLPQLMECSQQPHNKKAGIFTLRG